MTEDKKNPVTVIGFGGGGKGGGGGRVAQEVPDSLRSKQYAKVIDVLSEGEIEGLVNGLQSIYLNDTPIQGAHGEMNFQGVSYLGATGSQQGVVNHLKTAAPAFAFNMIRNTSLVSAEIKHGYPIVRTISTPNLDRLEVTIGIPQLTLQDKTNGDVKGTEVEVKIEIENGTGAGYRTVNLSDVWVASFTTVSAGVSKTNSDASSLQVAYSTNSKTERDIKYRRVGTSTWLTMKVASASKVQAGFPGGSTGGTWNITHEAKGLQSGIYEVSGTQGATGLSMRYESMTGNAKFTGKTRSRYQRTYSIPLEGNGPWSIRLTRITEDAPDMSIQNQTWFDAISECVDAKLTMPNTAVVGLRVDSEQFGSIPSRGYEIKGLRVKVPSNYDPITRAYNGVWDGTFKIAWTDNPAWCFYDIVTNDRYGLGEFILPEQVDRFGLYQIGKYCDQLVPDGFGGQEPRFTCNLYIQTREDAATVLNSMASIFRGMAYWGNGMLNLVQDSPKYPVMQFTAANVIDGLFDYQGADMRARHTTALVSWNDPTDMYRQKVEFVQDDEFVERWGYNETEVLAVGCTSRGQAHRMGKWILYTEAFESNAVTFRAGISGLMCGIGDIIEISDSTRTGKRMSGRLLEGSTASTLKLDAPFDFSGTSGHEVSVMMPDGSIAKRGISNASGEKDTITLTVALPDIPVQNAIYTIVSLEVVPEKWRIVSMKEGENDTIEISALYHNDSKFASIEQNIALEIPPTSIVKTRPDAIVNLTAETGMVMNAAGVSVPVINLDWSNADGATRYIVEWKNGDDGWKSATTPSSDYTITDSFVGSYSIRVTGENSLGARGPMATVRHSVEAEDNAPAVANLRLNPNFSGLDLPFTWDAMAGATGYEVTILEPATGTVLRTDSTKEVGYTYTYAMNTKDGGPRRKLKVGVRAKTLLGQSVTVTYAEFENPAPAVPSGVIATGGMRLGSFECDPSTEMDYAGTIIWMSDVSTFTPSEATKVYDAQSTSFIITKDAAGKLLEGGKTYYIRAAHYDKFGKSGLNVTGSMALESLKNAPDLATINADMILPAVLDASKFAEGAEPVSIHKGASLPTVKATEHLNWQNKLYRWDGTKYTAAVPAADVTGTLVSAQIANNAITTAKFAKSIEPVTIHTGTSLPTTKSTETLTWNGKLYRWSGSAYVASVPAADVTGALVSSQISDAAITAAKFSTGIEPVTAHTGAALPTTKTTNALAWNGKLYRWDGSKYSAAIPATDLTGQLLEAQIANNAISAAKFAAGIEPVTTVSGSVLPTTKSTSTIYFQNKLYRWDGSKYSVAVDTSDLSGTIAAAQIAALEASKITGQLSSGQIASIEASKVSGTLTNAQIAAVDAAKLTGQITGTQITDGAVTTAKVAAGAIDANRIAAGAIVAGKIATEAIDAINIKANAITTAKIAANAVTANEIQAGTITAAEIAANAITAKHLLITDKTAVNGDPLFEDESQWDAPNTSFVPANGVGQQNTKAWMSSSIVSDWMGSTLHPIDPTKTYLFEVVVVGNSGQPGKTFASFRFFDRVKTRINASGAGWPAVNAPLGNHYLPSSQTVTPQAFVRYTISVGPNGDAKFPAGAHYVAIGAYFNYQGVSGYPNYFNMIRITEMARGELIVDGAITADKITANAITSDKIQAKAIIAGKFAAGSIAADDIASNAITAAKITAGAVTTDKMAANSIHGDRITGRTLHGNKITANTITANEIAANTITADQIAAGTITATQLAANSVTSTQINVANLAAINANMGSITGGSMNIGSGKFIVNSSGDVTANSITMPGMSAKNGVLTVDQLNVIKAGNIQGGDVTDGGVVTWGVTQSSSVDLTIRSITFTLKKDGYVVVVFDAFSRASQYHHGLGSLWLNSIALGVPRSYDEYNAWQTWLLPAASGVNTVSYKASSPRNWYMAGSLGVIAVIG